MKKKVCARSRPQQPSPPGGAAPSYIKRRCRAGRGITDSNSRRRRSITAAAAGSGGHRTRVGEEEEKEEEVEVVVALVTTTRGTRGGLACRAAGAMLAAATGTAGGPPPRGVITTRKTTEGATVDGAAAGPGAGVGPLLRGGINEETTTIARETIITRGTITATHHRFAVEEETEEETAGAGAGSVQDSTPTSSSTGPAPAMSRTSRRPPTSGSVVKMGSGSTTPWRGQCPLTPTLTFTFT